MTFREQYTHYSLAIDQSLHLIFPTGFASTLTASESMKVHVGQVS